MNAMNKIFNVVVNILFFCLLLIFIAGLAGCSGRHCISVGGNYSGIEGNLEYCYDAKSSEVEGVKIFNGNDEKNVLLSENDLEIIIEKIDEGSTVKTKNQENVFSRLRKILEKKE